MTIMKAKRVEGVTVDNLIHLDNYFSYVTRPEKYRDNSMYQWCGDDLKNVAMDYTRHYITDYVPRTYQYLERKVGNHGIFNHYLMWNADHIHKWFIEHLTCDNYEYDHYEVKKVDLQELIAVCIKVKKSAKMIEGRVLKGYRTIAGGKEHPVFEDGKIIEDISVAKQLLPVPIAYECGATNYDEDYIRGIDYTIEILKELVEDTDFENEIVIYMPN